MFSSQNLACGEILKQTVVGTLEDLLCFVHSQHIVACLKTTYTKHHTNQKRTPLRTPNVTVLAYIPNKCRSDPLPEDPKNSSFGLPFAFWWASKLEAKRDITVTSVYIYWKICTYTNKNTHIYIYIYLYIYIIYIYLFTNTDELDETSKLIVAVFAWFFTFGRKTYTNAFSWFMFMIVNWSVGFPKKNSRVAGVWRGTVSKTQTEVDTNFANELEEFTTKKA